MSGTRSAASRKVCLSFPIEISTSSVRGRPVDGLQAEHKPEALAKAKAKAKANTDLMLRSSAMAAPLALLPALPDLAMRGPKGILQPIVRSPHPPVALYTPSRTHATEESRLHQPLAIVRLSQ